MEPTLQLDHETLLVSQDQEKFAGGLHHMSELLRIQILLDQGRDISMEMML